MPSFLRVLVSATGRDCTSTTGCLFSPSVWCVHTRGSCVLPDSLTGRKVAREKLWREFFSNPSQWWDHRLDKINPKFPDFKHKKTGHSLWIVGNLTPAWVESELAAMTPGLLESHIFSWNLRLRRHVKTGDFKAVLNLFQQMQREGMILDKFTFVPVLNACSHLKSLEEGRRVHEEIIIRGCASDIYVANCLIDMYAKCGNIDDAWSVFSKMRKRDVVSWGSMIGGYVKSGRGLKAIETFQRMQREGVEPDGVTFVGVLTACASVAALEEGRRAHDQIIQGGYESDLYVATCLVDMYAKCGSINDALSVFNSMQERNVVSWGAMIGGYVKSGEGLKAIELFQKMQQERMEPDPGTFVGVLNACASEAALENGRRVHEEIIQRGCQSDMSVANCLVDMYAKCGSIEDAWRVFNKMQERDVVSWNAIIGGYVKSGQGLKALELFRKMQQGGIDPDAVTFVVVLNACASVAALEEGRCVHKQIIQRGCQFDVYVASCLVDMYAKCGSMEDALSLFIKMKERSVISWGAMIAGYVKSGQGLKAMELFQKMQQEGVEPEAVTFVAALNACASVASLEEGKRVHGQITQKGFESDGYVANCLVDMYAKCGSIEDAWSVFNRMQERDVVSWNAMIGGYAMHGHAKKALALFRQMGKEGLEVDGITFISLFSACSHGGLVKEGLRYFRSMTLFEIFPTTEHYACMVDLLGRADRLEEAEEMTKRFPMERSTSLLMSLLGACRIHGNNKIADRIAKRWLELDPENASDILMLNRSAAV